MSLLEERMRAPSHQGRIEGAAVGRVGNPACGDVLTVYLAIEGGVIRQASFESLGSPYQLATASVLCSSVEGMRVEDAMAQGPRCVLERLTDLPERNRYLSRLAVEALQLAIEAHRTPADRPRPVRRDLVDEEAARAFVLTLLDSGPHTTVQIEAAARAAGILLPVSTPKTLARLREAGDVEAFMAEDRRAWSWRRAPATSGSGASPRAT